MQYHEIKFRIPKLGMPRVKKIAHWLLPTPGNVLFTLLVIMTLFWTGSAQAFPWFNQAVPAGTSTGTWPYQGRLADSAGNPITNLVAMTFRIYNASTGGTKLWEEEWDGANRVQVSDGLFNVMLGSLVPIPQSVVTANSSLWLGIEVEDDTEMSPRVQLGSVPFAAQALTVPDGSIGTAKLADGAVTKVKLGADVIFIPPDGSITSEKIANGSISQQKAPSLIMSSSTNTKIAHGEATVIGDGSAQYYNSGTITINNAGFTEKPDIVCTIDHPMGFLYTCHVEYVTPTDFSIWVFWMMGQNWSDSVNVHWIAIGE